MGELQLQRAVVAGQPWLMNDARRFTARGRQGILQRCGDVAGRHRHAEPPGHDVAAEIIEDCAEIIPTSANDLQVGEVGLP